MSKSTTSSSSKTKNRHVLRSLSPSHSRFCSYTTSKTPFSSPSSPFASSTNSSFSSQSSSFFNHSHHRSASPTRLNFYNSVSLSSGFRFSIDSRSISPNRPIPNQIVTKTNRSIHKKTTCMCSPTTHPGSFRCSLHKNSNNGQADPFPSNRLSLNMRRSAMKNSLVRIGGVEGEWVKRALTALIRPSSHQQRRRTAFEPRPTRLSVMSKAQGV
ncbi:hypothetical protein Lalb_Chr11g0063621 [Lupinus albus]|uniref:Serine-rich protein-like protein n=1 Tax=Lupinus albus TaxID=3870 RepID=A0A6A4PQW7_LUPAL|nr:hypothetical protein Lalb_Chr11g0063621 [Lupinus albus]